MSLDMMIIDVYGRVRGLTKVNKIYIHNLSGFYVEENNNAYQ